MKSILLWILVLCTILPAADIPWADGRSKGENLRIKLVTFGPGDDVPSWWGHTGLLVEDLQYRKARIYNFGLFSFDDGMLFKFAMGRLIFAAGDFSVPGYLEWYRRQNRDVRIVSLDLPADKRLQLARKLAWYVRPENRRYLYHHYDENCATRLRDLLDKAVDGALYRQADAPGRMTLRQHTRRYVGHNVFMEMLLMYLMNDSIDKPIKVWQEMFLPDELERQVMRLTYQTPDGQKRRLAADRLIFFKADRPPVPEWPPVHWPGALITGLLIGGIALALVWWYKSTNNDWAITWLGVWNFTIGLVLGIPGLGLALMAGFTDHTVTYYNENLLLANPLTVLLIPYGFMLARQKAKALRGLQIIWYIHLAAALLLLALKILPAFDQDNFLVICFILPIICGFSLAFYILGKNKEKTIDELVNY